MENWYGMIILFLNSFTFVRIHFKMLLLLYYQIYHHWKLLLFKKILSNTLSSLYQVLIIHFISLYSDIPNLIELIVDKKCFTTSAGLSLNSYFFLSIFYLDLDHFTTLSLGMLSFEKANTLILNSTFVLISLLELPLLSSISIGTNSFTKTEKLVLESILFVYPFY